VRTLSAGEAPVAAPTAPLSLRAQLEAACAALIIFIIAFLPSTAKLFTGEDADNSVLGELVWSSIYLFCGIRVWAFRGRAFPLLRKCVPFLVWLVIVFASTIWSNDPFTTFKSAGELAGTVLIGTYFVVRYPLRKFLEILESGYFAIGSLSLFLVFASPIRGKSEGPFNGIFSDKNGLGSAMALATISLVLLILQTRGRRRLYLAALLALCLILLGGSNSVTAIVTLTGVAALALIGWMFRSRLYAALFAVALLTIVPTILAFGLYGLDPDRIFLMLGRSALLSGRTDMWPGLLTAVRDQPIFGFGYNCFFRGGGPYRDYLATFLLEYNWDPPHAHNSFLQIALDTGLVGLSAFVVTLWFSVKRAIAFFMLDRNAISLWPFAIIAYLVLGSYDETYFSVANTMNTVLFVAAMLYPIVDRSAAPKLPRRRPALIGRTEAEFS
jgi:exopolysaccharide production protein ExoQ